MKDYHIPELDEMIDRRVTGSPGCKPEDITEAMKQVDFEIAARLNRKAEIQQALTNVDPREVALSSFSHLHRDFTSDKTRSNHQ